MRWKLTLLALAVAVGSGAALWWLRPDSRTLSPRLIVLGIDGLDDRVLRRLVAAGELPNFGRLLREGASGTIRNSEIGLPPVSPAIWTTYVTGVTKDEHGIYGFVFNTPQGWELYRSVQRKRPALWEILSQNERTVGVVNWWFSFPPEAIRGFIVTDRYFESELKGLSEITFGRATGMEAPVIYPPLLAETITVSRQQKLPKVLDAKSARTLDSAMLDLAYRSLQAVPVETLLVYLNGLDRVSHRTWDAADIEGCGGVEVRRHLKTLDEFVGELWQRMPAASHLVLLSDHGFEPNPKGRPPGAHESQEAADAAVLLLYGPKVEPGKALGSVSPFDVLPTVLALLEVPLPQGTRGAVVQAFRGRKVETSQLPRRSYMRLAAVSGTLPASSGEDAVDAATKERLRALGYLEDK
ncbi:MAG: hypothetical protein KatS3mg077_1342 [Candidatus Binatia bacterium]|nr:MAG: hypothetical protein KatS3mg077_1342 [Candidatus Binatia bacterium]